MIVCTSNLHGRGTSRSILISKSCAEKRSPVFAFGIALPLSSICLLFAAAMILDADSVGFPIAGRGGNCPGSVGMSLFALFVIMRGLVLLLVKGSSAFWPPLTRISSKIASSARSTLLRLLRSLINEMLDKVLETFCWLRPSAFSSNWASSKVNRSVSSSSPL